MTPKTTRISSGDERGFILATILIFMVILTITAFYAAGMSRTDVAVVNNIQNEKEAFFIAEAGANEALKRLSWDTSTNVTVSGVSGAFDAAFVAKTPVDLHPDETNAAWEANILFDPTVTASKTGSVVTAQSIAPVADRSSLTYSTTSADTATLKIKWDLCTAVNASAGCSAVGAMRKINNRPVLKVVSTGQVRRSDGTVVAERTVTVASRAFCSLPGLGVYGNGCDPPTGGIDVNGSVSISADGGMQINSSGSSPCQVIDGSNNQTFTSDGPINVGTNGTWDNNPVYDPAPQSGTNKSDPLASMASPCWITGVVTGCDLTYPGYPPLPQGPNLTSACSAPYSPPNGTASISPGIYYCGLQLTRPITMQPGVYIIAGGGFEVTGTGNVTANNVMIYNTRIGTQTSGAGALGSINLHSNPTVNFSSPASGPYQGIVMFQDRDSTIPLPEAQVNLQGGDATTSSINGVVYAINAQINLQGGINLQANILARSLSANGNTSITAAPSTPSSICLGTFGGLDKNLAWSDY